VRAHDRHRQDQGPGAAADRVGDDAPHGDPTTTVFGRVLRRLPDRDAAQDEADHGPHSEQTEGQEADQAQDEGGDGEPLALARHRARRRRVEARRGGWRHRQADRASRLVGQVLQHVVDQDERRHEEGDDAPPPAEQCDQGELLEVLLRAGRADVAFHGLVETDDQRPDVLMELDPTDGAERAARFAASGSGRRG
jgi:hypothetical protein